MSQTPSRLESVLSTAFSAPAGTVTVVQAPPGEGKSTTSYRLIAEALRYGSKKRVLWVTHSTVREASLGREAQEAFQKHGVKATLIEGIEQLKQHTSGRFASRYHQQMKWGDDPEVKIVSHAHLPLIFGAPPHGSMQELGEADLVVIDEDPIRALLLNNSGENSMFSLRDLWENRDPDDDLTPILRDAGQVEIISPIPTIVSAPEAWGTPVGKSGLGLYQEPFWELLADRFPAGFNVEAFTRTLFRAAQDQAGFTEERASLVARELLHDLLLYRTSGEISNRFGLHRVPGRPDHFRFNVRLPLSFQQPVVVLDGYANREIYQAAFLGHPLYFEMWERPSQVLEVEVSSALRLRRDDIEQERNRQHIQRIAFELVHLTQEAREKGKKLLVLVHKDVREAGFWQTVLQDTFQKCDAEELQVETFDETHWHAGRGLNRWQGHDVVALTEVAIPLVEREYVLSAIFPTDGTARHRAMQHFQGAEVLQMLNRGRQPQFPAGSRPRVISGTDLPEDWKTWYSQKDYTPRFRYEKHSDRGLWYVAMDMCTRELLKLLGAVPELLLQEVGLTESTSNELILKRLHGQLKTRIRKGASPILHGWKTDPKDWVFSEVKPASRTLHSKVQMIMSDLGLKKFRFNIHPVKSKLGLKNIQTNVYGVDEAQALTCLQELLGPQHRVTVTRKATQTK